MVLIPMPSCIANPGAGLVVTSTNQEDGLPNVHDIHMHGVQLCCGM